MEECPVCLTPGVRRTDHGEVYHYSCMRCGEFLTGPPGIWRFGEKPAVWDRMRLSFALRRRADRRLPLVTVHEDNWREKAAAAHAPLDAAEALDAFLQSVLVLNPLPGSAVPIGQFTAPWAGRLCCKDEDIGRCLDDFRALGLLQPGAGVGLTSKGLMRAADARRAPESDQAFVAMRFSDEMFTIYREAICPALEAVGYAPFIVEDRPDGRKIDERIISEIRRSSMVVADFTDNRPNVHHEAGFAYGLGLPVVWCCRADQEKDMAFDTRQFPHLLWSDAEELRVKLVDHIRARGLDRSHDRSRINGP